MIAATYDFSIRKGSDVSELFQIQDADGAPLDLTGWEIHAQIREGKSFESELIAEFSVAIPDPTDGKIYLELENAVTAAITQKKGYYDILYIDPTLKRKFYCEGTIAFRPSRTFI
jgi:hypothetical protein